MATEILSTMVVEDVASQIVLQSHPGIEDRPKAFDAFTRATAALIQPQLENLVHAYLKACKTPCGREGARIFLLTMLDSED